jgi:hypothetical protein
MTLPKRLRRCERSGEWVGWVDEWMSLVD